MNKKTRQLIFEKFNGMWHSTSYSLTVEAQNTIYKLTGKVEELKKSLEDLNKKYMSEKQHHRRELSKQTEIIKKNELINKKDKTIKMLRETISNLIYKLNQLELKS